MKPSLDREDLCSMDGRIVCGGTDCLCGGSRLHACAALEITQESENEKGARGGTKGSEGLGANAAHPCW